MNKLLSVIVPIYNVQKFLKKCILSIINQTYKNLEIILVNDGSTDKSQEICESFLKLDNRIHLINKDNGGLSDARNVGIEYATGDYIAFVDSDDYLDLMAFERMLTEMLKCDLDIISGYPIPVYENGTVINNLKKREAQNKVVSGEEYLVRCIKEATMLWPVQFSIYKRSLLNGLEFKKGILHEDMLWTPQVFLRAKKVECIDFEFYYYLQRENSITHQKKKYKNGCDIINSCYDLEKIYKTIVNDSHKKILMDNLVEHYLNGFYIARILHSDESCKVRKSFVVGKAKKVRNILKVMIFLISKRFYLFVNDIIKGVK